MDTRVDMPLAFIRQHDSSDFSVSFVYQLITNLCTHPLKGSVRCVAAVLIPLCGSRCRISVVWKWV